MSEESKSRVTEKVIHEMLAYYRVSDLGQTKDQYGHRLEDGSPDAQKKKCEDYARHLSGKTGFEYRIVDHICDEGFSGTNTKRPGYQRLWDSIASGRIKAVVASELSRLSRSVTDFLALIAHCERYGVQVHIIGLDLDTSAPFGRVIVVILVALAQFESEMTKKRVKENILLRLLNDGRINGAREILGLVADPNRKGHFIADEAGLIAAEKILRLFVKFSSKDKVLQMATELGLNGPNGKALTLSVIESVIGNAQWRYRGLWHTNRENKDKPQETLPVAQQFKIVKLPHGALLDATLLDEVEHKQADTYKTKKRTGKDNYTYLLSHSLQHEDGSAYTGQPGKGRRYRYYHNRVHDKRIRCDVIDPIITERVKACFQENDRFVELLRAAILRRQNELPKLDAEISRVRKLFQDLKITENDMTTQMLDPARRADPVFMPWLEQQVRNFKLRKSQLEVELLALERQREDILKKVGCEDTKNAAISFVHDFDKLNGTERRNILERFVSKIVITDDQRLVLHFRGKPLTNNIARWRKSTDKDENGGPSRTRTCDQEIMSLLL